MNVRAGGMFSGMFGGGGSQGGGGTPSGGGGESGSGEQSGRESIIPGGDQEENEETQYSPLADIFGSGEDDDDSDSDADDGDEDEGDDDSGGKKPKGKVKPEEGLVKDIQKMLSGFKITDEDLGEDFDPTDPKKFAAAITKIQQKTAIATMQMSFKPMQVAMEQLSNDLRTHISKTLAEHGKSTKGRNALESLVPEINDPELGGFVQTLYDQALKKGHKGEQAAQATRKAIDALGIKSKSGGRKSNDPSEGASLKQGKEALDLYGPLPTRK